MRSLITLGGGVRSRAACSLRRQPPLRRCRPRARARSPRARPTTRPPQQAAGSILYMNAEPEMRSAINPTNARNIVGAYQQDRWNDGGARGLVSSWSKDGGQTWHPVSIPGVTQVLGRHLRSRLRPVGLVRAERRPLRDLARFDAFDTHNAIIVNKSTTAARVGPGARDHRRRHERPRQGGDHRGPVRREPRVRRLGPLPVAARPQRERPGQVPCRSRTSSRPGSRARPTAARRWEPARVAFNPGTHAGTIGNIVIVLPNGPTTCSTAWSSSPTTSRSSAGPRSRSSARPITASTWSKKATVIAQIDPGFHGATDPDNGHPIRGGELPDFAVDPHNGNVYAVWEDDSLTGSARSSSRSRRTAASPGRRR